MMALPIIYLQVQQYKHERECNSILAQTREDKILRLESLMDGILPTEDFMEVEFVSLKHEHEVWLIQIFLAYVYIFIYTSQACSLPMIYSF